MLGTHGQWSISASFIPFLLGKFPDGDGEMGVVNDHIFDVGPPNNNTTRSS